MHRFWRKQAQFLALTAVALVAACSASAPTDNGSNADAGFVFPDAGKDAKDTTAADAPDVSVDIAHDASDVTATDTADTSDADTNGFDCTAEPGAPGCPCQDNSTCDLLICLPTAQGSQCAKACVDACPDGFKCVGVAGPGGDIQPACVDKSPHLCDPCVNSVQCGAVGLQGAACVDKGKDGRFCGTACKADTDCPGGYSCASVTSVEGNSVQQCQPTGSASCTCSPSAIADQLSTSCFAEAKDANGTVVGQCKGVRACAPDGLSACNASIQTETCNGQDDDCDGLVDEGTCDDKNPCTMDTCDGNAQTCNHSNTPGACDADGNNCTVGDTCVDGKCTIGSLKSCDDNNPCTTDACDPLAGCTKSNDDGLPCSDGSGCTVGDTCTGGICVSGTAKTCPTGDACLSWACDGATGSCKQTATADGTSCSDGTVCTDADVCAGGSCAGTPVSCDDKNACTLDTCDPIAGCTYVAANTPCDDANACTTGDTCAAKKCTGTPIDIKTECGDGNPCTTDTCDKIAGCVYAANTGNCSDGNACTIGDVCADKACKSGTNTCTCQQDSECASKEDGNFCNGTLFCDKSGPSNQCKVNPATIVTCNTSGDGQCDQTTCIPATGVCAVGNLPDGKSCDADGTVCTSNDACLNGVCTAGPQKNCNDNNVCTDDACDSVQGCLNTNNVSPCDADGNACTMNDTCSGKLCIAGPKKVCNDGIDCTADACDQVSGSCVFDGTAMTGAACDDKNVCTVSDKCDGKGNCVGGAAASCDDGNACTIDSCASSNGCSHVTATDHTTCGTTLWCVAGACVAKVFCGDGVVNQASEQCDDGNNSNGDGCDSACQFEAAYPKPGELIITEMMPEPKGNYQDEWLEIYNNSSKALLLTGLNFGDNNAYIAFPKTPAGTAWVLNPGRYAVIAALEPIGGSKGVVIPDYTYGYFPNGIQFANGSDYACISGPNDTQCATDIIVKASYSTTKSGQSWELKLSKYATAFTITSGSASIGTSNWCYGTAPIAGGEGNQGTPGFADPNCP